MDPAPPRKRDFKQRPHSNVLMDHKFDVPVNHHHVNYTKFFPGASPGQRIEIIDIGCGYGKMLYELGRTHPNQLCLGMEIRVKVTEFVEKKILSLRSENKDKQINYNNIFVVRINSMKFLQHYIGKDQLKKIFILFPDPHFKKSKHKHRIIRQALLDEYHYNLVVGGIIYFASDVEDYYKHVEYHMSLHNGFRKMTESELTLDQTYQKLHVTTDEGINVTNREGGAVYKACYMKIDYSNQQKRAYEDL